MNQPQVVRDAEFLASREAEVLDLVEGSKRDRRFVAALSSLSATGALMISAAFNTMQTAYQSISLRPHVSSRSRSSNSLEYAEAVMQSSLIAGGSIALGGMFVYMKVRSNLKNEVSLHREATDAAVRSRLPDPSVEIPVIRPKTQDFDRKTFNKFCYDKFIN